MKKRRIDVANEDLPGAVKHEINVPRQGNLLIIQFSNHQSPTDLNNFAEYIRGRILLSPAVICLPKTATSKVVDLKFE